MNIQDAIGKVFGSRDWAYSMVVNDYFDPIRTNIPHATPNYRPEKSKFEIYYYRQTFGFPEKLDHIQVKLKKSRSISVGKQIP